MFPCHDIIRINLDLASGDTNKATGASASTNIFGEKNRAKAPATSKTNVSGDNGKATAGHAGVKLLQAWRKLASRIG